MTADHMTWLEPLNPVSDDAIARMETQLHISLPKDYRSFLQRYQGGVPAETDFALSDRRKKHVSIGSFLSVDAERAADYIPRVRELLSDRLPLRVIPIAIGPGGDYVTMDFRSPSPSVVYWHHERTGDPDEFTPIAPSFGGFLSLLYEPDIEAESKLD